MKRGISLEVAVTWPGRTGLRKIRNTCVLVHWYSCIGDEPDKMMGMWIVEPDLCDDGMPVEEIIHIDCILWAAHLIGVYGEAFVP
jgi:hypothetical protein